MLKDSILSGKEKLDFNKYSKINYDSIIEPARKEISNLFTFYNHLKTQGYKDIYDKIKQKIEGINKKYEGKNQFLETLFPYHIDESQLVLVARLYEEKFRLIKDKIQKEDKDYFEKLAYKYDSRMYMTGTMLDPFAPVAPWDLWYFSNMQELEDGFIKYYEKFSKLASQELEVKNNIESLKQLGFKYSYRTKTYLKVLNIENTLQTLPNYSLYDIHDVKVNILISNLVKNKIAKKFSKEGKLKDKTINISSNSEDNCIYLQSLGKLYLDEENFLEVLKILTKENNRIYLLSANDDTNIEKIFNFFKQAYSADIDYKKYFNFSSYNSLILNILQFFDKKSVLSILLNKDQNLSELIRKNLKLNLGELFPLQNIVSVDYKIKSINMKNEKMSLYYEIITYPYFPKEDSKIKKITCEQTLSFNHLKVNLDVKGKGWGKEFYSIGLNGLDGTDLDYLIYGYDGNIFIKQIYEAHIPYEYIHLPKEERFSAIRNYVFTKKAKFRHISTESKGYRWITD